MVPRAIYKVGFSIVRKLFVYKWFVKQIPQLPDSNCTESNVSSKKNKNKHLHLTTFTLHFVFWQCPHPPLHRPNCCALALLTWSSSWTQIPFWGMALLPGRRLSTVPASPPGPRCMASTWSPINCGTWIQTRSTTSVCCSPGLEKEALAPRDLLLWVGPSAQVSVRKCKNCKDKPPLYS